MKIIGYITTAVVAIIVSSILNGYALSVLWGWFIVSTFSLPIINIPTAIGLALTVGFLTKQDSKNESEDSDEAIKNFITAIFTAILKPFIFLLIGWIVTLFL